MKVESSQRIEVGARALAYQSNRDEERDMARGLVYEVVIAAVDERGVPTAARVDDARFPSYAGQAVHAGTVEFWTMETAPLLGRITNLHKSYYRLKETMEAEIRGMKRACEAVGHGMRANGRGE